MTSQRVRPGPVTFLALIQFAGAAFLILVVLFTLLDPAMNLASQKFTATAVYLLTRRNMMPKPWIPLLMPLAAAYLALTGWGLWTLQKWSRHVLVGTSGLTVILWLRALFVREWALGDSLMPDPWARQTGYALILFNVCISACLLLYPDVAPAFNEEE